MTIYDFINTGAFGEKKIFYRYYPCHEASITYIFFHGAFSSSLKNRYKKLAKRLVANNYANVLTFESSRKMYSFEKKELGNFGDYKTAFAGKKFVDELFDVGQLLNHFFKNIFSRSKKSRVVFVGFSLGGTLASFFLEKYKKYVEKVYLFGSGVSTKGINDPILSTYPDKSVILDNFHKFKGQIVLVQGTKDEIVPIKDAREIILQDSLAKSRELLIINGVDHRFMTIDGADREKELNKLILNIIIR